MDTVNGLLTWNVSWMINSILLLALCMGIGPALKGQTPKKWKDKPVKVTLMDGSLLYADSLSFQDPDLLVFQSNLRFQLKRRNSYQQLDYWEVFKVNDRGTVTILYKPDEKDPTVEDMQLFITGRIWAKEDFDKTVSYATGFGTGFASGYFIGSSLIAFPTAFASSWLYTKIPIGGKQKRNFEHPYQRRGYKREIRQSRFMPFLFANLLGTAVGLYAGSQE